MAIILKENEIKPAEQTIDGGVVAIFEATFYGEMTERDMDDAGSTNMSAVSGGIGVEPVHQVVESVGLSTTILRSSFEDQVPSNTAPQNILQRFEKSVLHIAEANPASLSGPPRPEVLTGGTSIAPTGQIPKKSPRYLVTVYSTASAPEESLQRFFRNPTVLKRVA